VVGALGVSLPQLYEQLMRLLLYQQDLRSGKGQQNLVGLKHPRDHAALAPSLDAYALEAHQALSRNQPMALQLSLLNQGLAYVLQRVQLGLCR